MYLTIQGLKIWWRARLVVVYKESVWAELGPTLWAFCHVK